MIPEMLVRVLTLIYQFYIHQSIYSSPSDYLCCLQIVKFILWHICRKLPRVCSQPWRCFCRWIPCVQHCFPWHLAVPSGTTGDSSLNSVSRQDRQDMYSYLEYILLNFFNKLRNVVFTTMARLDVAITYRKQSLREKSMGKEREVNADDPGHWTLQTTLEAIKHFVQYWHSAAAVRGKVVFKCGRWWRRWLSNETKDGVKGCNG